MSYRCALPYPSHAFAEIIDLFYARYGDHLSKEDVEALVAPCISGTPPMEFHVWKHAQDGDVLVRTTEYSLPAYLDEHIELIQPTTAFNRAKRQRTTSAFSWSQIPLLLSPDAKITVPDYGVTVDASCNTTITVSCLKQLYNAVNYVPCKTNKNAIAITGYLEEFANFDDLKLFYADQLSAGVNTLLDVVLINDYKGGLNNPMRDLVEEMTFPEPWGRPLIKQVVNTFDPIKQLLGFVH
ncbi:hypothetical protein BJV78DRAFT_1154023 [Lactifluus subvellereus]|nr:hypothetical protein BJV78DRAFT_1154023 [Lactifluus subvellereus]